ncbi:hydrogen peroxide-inducible genes activator [Falsirhodobacter algicola]|uniref:LysR family transcriptional regulator n=1 Tax=Falsirhodobacter algicola TaxID=2692330 RepID=A0A8J8SK79_9RHOB|nr:hydrogen peroxide-inducible genes activator [Falsirhodobacter algicola]QUS35082.1 LysR family transcriptional regulator [Falsirhodobacter algicola]
MLTLRQLSYFLALAETRHFGHAAAKVHVTQPALSMQIREMEASLGMPLLERGRELRLTPAGREVAARAARVLAEVREIETMARRRTLGGQINIGMIPTVAPYLLPDLLPRLPLQLRLREAQTDRLLTELRDGVLDAVVVATKVRPDDLVVRPLFRDRFLLAANAARLEALPSVEDLRPVTLDPEQLLLLDEGHCLADQALEVCGLERRGTRLDLGASSLSTLAGLVGQGVGITFMPEIAVPTEAAAHPSIRLARFSAPEPARDVALIGRVSTAAEPWFATLAGALIQTAEQRLALCP